METDRNKLIGQLLDILQESWEQAVDKQLDEGIWLKGEYRFSFMVDGAEYSGGQLERDGQVVYATSHFPNLIERIAQV